MQRASAPPPPLQMHPPSPKDGSSPRNGMCSLDALVMAVPSPGTPTSVQPARSQIRDRRAGVQQGPSHSVPITSPTAAGESPGCAGDPHPSQSVLGTLPGDSHVLAGRPSPHTPPPTQGLLGTPVSSLGEPQLPGCPREPPAPSPGSSPPPP